MSDPENRDPEAPKRTTGQVPSSSVGLFVTAGANAVVFVLLRLLPGFDIPILNSDLGQVLPALILSVSVQIVGNLVLAFYRPRRIYFLFQIIFSAVTFRALFILNKVFPFTFPEELGFPVESFLHAFLLFLMVLTGLGLASHIRSLMRRLVDFSVHSR